MKLNFNPCSIFIASLLVLAGSCKKSTPLPANTPASAYQSNSYNGLFDSQLMYSVAGASSYMSPSATDQAYMSSIAFTNLNAATGTLMGMGSVSLNGITFKNSSGFYQDTTFLYHASPDVWQVSGGTIPAFTFTNTNSFPTIGGYIAWPDTIVKSQGFTLSLTGQNSVDEMKITLANINSATQILYGEPPGTTTLAIPASVLSSLTTSIQAQIRVEVYHNNFQVMGSNKFNFRNTSIYTKVVAIKN